MRVGWSRTAIRYNTRFSCMWDTDDFYWEISKAVHGMLCVLCLFLFKCRVYERDRPSVQTAQCTGGLPRSQWVWVLGSVCEWVSGVTPCPHGTHTVRKPAIQILFPKEQAIIMYPKWYKNVPQSLCLYHKMYIYLHLGYSWQIFEGTTPVTSNCTRLGSSRSLW